MTRGVGARDATPASLALRLASRRAVPIWIFHRVDDGVGGALPNLGATPLADFQRRLDFIESSFRVVPLIDVVRRLASGRPPWPGVTCLTFDDGYPDWTGALAAELKRRSMPATFFVTSGSIDGPPHWHDRIRMATMALPEDPQALAAFGLASLPRSDPAWRERAGALIESIVKYQDPAQRDLLIARFEAVAGVTPAALPTMSLVQLRELAAAGFDIGAHSVHHPILASCTTADAEREIAGSREQLRAWIRQPIDLFAYPNGRPGFDYTAVHVEQVRRAGFAGAVSTARGWARPSSSIWELPRVQLWGRSVSQMAWPTARAVLLKPPPVAQGSGPVRVLSVETGSGFGGAVVALDSLLKASDPAAASFTVAANSDSGGLLKGARSLARIEAVPSRHLDLRPIAARIDRLPVGKALRRALLFGLGRLDDLVNRWPYFLRLLAVALRHRPDVVHGNNDPGSNREAMAVARVLRLPYLQHVRGPISHVTNLTAHAGRPVIFMPVSRWLAGELLQTGIPAEQVRQIYDGLPMSQRPRVTAAQRPPELQGLSGPLVAMVGMLTPWKGQQLFIEAVADLRRRGALRGSFLIVGGTPEHLEPSFERALKDQVAQAGLGDVVHFTGLRRDLPEWLPHLDVVVSASLQPEPLGLVMIEAMAAGCVFVGPAFGAAVEAIEIGRNGLLFAPGDAKSLSRALETALALIDSGDAAALGERGRTDVQHFDVRASAEATRQVLITAQALSAARRARSRA